MVKARGAQIIESLKNAASDTERDRWGPDGDEIKELEDETDTYAQLLETLSTLAVVWRAFETHVKPEDRTRLARSPLGELVNGVLSDRVLRAGSLKRETRETTELAEALAMLSSLYARFVRLEEDARERDKDQQAEKVAAKRLELLRTATDSEDAKALAGDARELGEPIYGPADDGSPDAPGDPGAGGVGIADADAARYPRFVLGPGGLGDLPGRRCSARPLVTVPRQVGPGGWLERNFSLADAAFFLLTLILVLLSGLLALYYTTDTWGSTGDEIGALFWGSTATAGTARAAACSWDIQEHHGLVSAATGPPSPEPMPSCRSGPCSLP